MYGYKRNHIQICPQYRKHFRRAEHTLYICLETEMYERRHGCLTRLSKSDFEHREIRKIKHKIFAWCRKRYYEYYQPIQVVHCIEYCLHVPSLPGQVEGLYYNYTFGNLGDVKRRLKRLLRCKKLNIVYVNTWEEFRFLERNSR